MPSRTNPFATYSILLQQYCVLIFRKNSEIEKYHRNRRNDLFLPYQRTSCWACDDKKILLTFLLN